MVERLVEYIKEHLNGFYGELKLINGNELYVEVRPENIKKVCIQLYTGLECRLVCLHANDERPLGAGISLYYTFSVRENGTMVIVKTPAEELDSISVEIPAASFYEREIKDMFGVRFKGAPDGRELVFHGNWPEGLNPLLKDYDIRQRPEFTDREPEFLKIDGTGVFEIPVGPVHAGIIEPGHFRFSVAGEPIINLEAKLYYVHKGIEKLAEGQSVEKAFFLSERISGDETCSNSLAFCQAVEKLALRGQVPERAMYARTILCEMERIYNHIGDIAGICTDTAYSFAACQFNMMRRWCLIMNEEITGSRFLRSALRPGGLRRECIAGKEKSLSVHLEKLCREFNDTVEIIKSNSLFIDRVENCGIVSLETARDLNAVGPAARAAGIRNDARVVYPYAAYDKIGFDIPQHNNGDVNCRLNVKIEEVNTSIRIVLQALEKIPQKGDIYEAPGKLEQYKCAYGITESPRGENCHWVMAGENNTIFRYKIRTPSFCNWPVLCHAVKGNIVPDFPLINKSFNLSYAGNDL